ncbi:MAG TPA: hypothetical protein VGK77_24000 [Candidatus Binatia bacterium]|jgi:hypothetical protein
MLNVEKRRRWRWETVLVYIVAVAVNYLWELAQAPLYVGMEIYNSAIFGHCFVASLGDGVMVLLIVAAGWVTLRQQDWFQQPNVSGYLLMLTTGFVMSVMVEWLGVHILRRWEYSENMPMLPGLSIGLIPIAQMLFLPPVIFRIVAVLGSRKIWKPSKT